MISNSTALVPTSQPTWWARCAAPVFRKFRWAARQSRSLYLKLHPDLRQQLGELPYIAVTQLAPRTTPELLLPQGTKKVTVFVHGYGGSRGNFLPMQSYFRMMRQEPTLSVGFHDTSSIEAMADELRSLLHSLIIRHDLPEGSIDLVAHSLGGIISRVAIEDPTLAACVKTLVTLATPHKGSLLARYLDTPICRGLRPGSQLLTRLEQQSGWGQAGKPRLVSFWTPQDCILLPAESGELEGAENIFVPDCTHLTFLLKPSIWQLVLEELAR